VGIVVDHGVREGIPTEFFGHKTLSPTGAIRFTHFLDTPLLPAYILRIKGPYHKIKILSPFTIEKTGNEEKDLAINLEKINRILEDYIKKFPDQYLWFYKRWKYSRQKDLLVLVDGKTGHLRQLESLIKVIKEVAEEKNYEFNIKKVKIVFKNRFMKGFQVFCTTLASRYHCRGCLWCLRRTLDRSSYEELERTFADIVVSCGSSTAYVNFVLSSELKAKSMHIMRPGLLSTKRFDLVIMPEHDSAPKRRNVIVTKGSLNLIDDEYLKEQTENLLQISNFKFQTSNLKIGLLIGGDTKDFRLSEELMVILVKELKKLIYELNANILVTTSRRTPKEIELLVKKEFLNEPRCSFLVIANEKNLTFAVGGILGLSDMVVISPDSVSMISEAASSGKYVIVFKQKDIPKRKRLFLENLEQAGFIRIVNVDGIYSEVKDILKEKPPIKRLDDHPKILEAMRKIL
jgi:mitochondrial fission protein ELM1